MMPEEEKTYLLFSFCSAEKFHDALHKHTVT